MGEFRETFCAGQERERVVETVSFCTLGVGGREGHPDKNRGSDIDGVLDAVLSQDPFGRVASARRW